MEIAKTKIDVTVYGNKYSLKAPNALEVADFGDEISADKKLSNKDIILKTNSFLSKMGLPEDICADLEIDHLNQIIDFITKKK